MGKRKIGFKKAKHGIDDLANAASSDEDQLEGHLESLLDDEIDKYNEETENSLLKNKSKGKPKKRPYQDSSDEEQEVFGLDVSSDDDNQGGGELDEAPGSSDDDEEEDDNDDDILGKDRGNDGIPDSRAWGRKARAYFNTDYIDQDFGGFEGSDAEMAEQEEAEAKEIQKRLTAELDEGDFIDFLPTNSEKSKKSSKIDQSKEILKIDFDHLSISEKRKLVQRECPEVIHMLEELKEKLKIAKDVKKDIQRSEDKELNEFYHAKLHTLLNYCINISYFLHLRSTKPSNCKGHPVIKRILQFRRLLDEVNQFKPKAFLEVNESVRPPKAKRPKKQVPTLAKEKRNERETTQDEGLGEQLKKKVKFSKAIPAADAKEETKALHVHLDELEKRKITYEMAKNKGLVPSRKKEQRNPRVKHRMKYQKAKVRRKGQVRTPRTETSKYDGESYGIKSHVTKSIKLS